MSFSAILIMSVCLFKSSTAEADTCSAISQAASETDTHTLLMENATYRLHWSTFRFDSGDRYRCVWATTTTISQTENKREVTETVQYKNITAKAWAAFSQDFELYRNSDGINEMKTIGNSGAPQGTYQFLSEDPYCIIIKALNFIPADTGAVCQEECDASQKPEANAVENCMLWMKDDREKPEGSCLDCFNRLCKQSAVEGFGKAECQDRPTTEHVESTISEV